jgi:antirestriction factor ArdC-like protein
MRPIPSRPRRHPSGVSREAASYSLNVRGPAAPHAAGHRVRRSAENRELPMRVDRFDIHQHITAQIVSAIERGASDFRLPWHRAAGSILRPINIASKEPYRGINVVALWAYAEEFGYSSGVWGTYRQWAEAGAQVRKGEKAAFVVFYKELEVAADPETGDAESATRLFARATPGFAPNKWTAIRLPSATHRRRRSPRRSNKPRPSSPRPALPSITTAAGPFIVFRLTASNFPHATLSSAARPARRRNPTMPRCVMSFATGPAMRAVAIGSSASASAIRPMRWRSWLPNSEPRSSAPISASPTIPAPTTRNISGPGWPC